MNAALNPKRQALAVSSVRDKLALLDGDLELLLKGGSLPVPEIPGRDVQILPLRELPAKKGLSTMEGQARLIHDLASIELQAMELGLRTLCEFPDAPLDFREQLGAVILDEAKHLRLCLEALDDIGLPWGAFPTHVMLWASASPTDSLLDRILIVHRYLEGSGLDATDTILRRLSGVRAVEATRAIEVIRRDELGHVLFGSRWYHNILRNLKLDPETDFKPRLLRLYKKVPRRIEPINRELGRSAGFLDCEIDALEAVRRQWLEPSAEKIHT